MLRNVVLCDRVAFGVFDTHPGLAKSMSLAQLPPTLRGVRDRGTKPRVEVIFHGWSGCGFRTRLGVNVASSDD